MTTVDSVEALSGYDVLALLPDPIEIPIEGGTEPLSPAGTIQYVIDLVNDLVATGALSHGDGRTLSATLTSALRQVERGRTPAAITLFGVFLRQVYAFVQLRSCSKIMRCRIASLMHDRTNGKLVWAA